LKLSLLPFFPFHWNTTLKDMEKHRQCRNNKSTTQSNSKRSSSVFSSSRDAFQHSTHYASCGRSDAAMLSYHLCMDG
jgi:hypothetical protein